MAPRSLLQALKVARPFAGAVHLNQMSGVVAVHSSADAAQFVSTGTPALAVAVSVENGVGTSSWRTVALVHSSWAKSGAVKAPAAMHAATLIA